MIYLVTGGAGFIGSNLVEELLKNNHKVIVIDDFSTGKKENLTENRNLTISKKSILDDLNNIPKKEEIECVFHLAALPRVQFSIKNPIITHNANVNGTLNLLNFCKENNIKKFIFSSSSSIYGDQKVLPLKENLIPNPMSPYALHKLIGEYYCKIYNKIFHIETIALRYFNVYGPKQDHDGEYSCLIPKFIKLIKNNISPIINGSGEQRRDFTFVSDVVNANISASKIKDKEFFGDAFNIGSGKNFSVNDVTNMILKLTNKTIKPTYGNSVIEPKETLADITKAKEILSWEPKISLEEGIKRII